MRGPVEKQGRLPGRRPERRRAAVAHYVREPGGPGASGHGAADPSLGRPTVEHRLPNEGSASQDLGRDREPKPRRCHQRRRRPGRGGNKGNRRSSRGPGPPGRRAMPWRGVASSYSATFSGQCASSSTASVCLNCTRRSESRAAPSRKAHNGRGVKIQWPSTIPGPNPDITNNFKLQLKVPARGPGGLRFPACLSHVPSRNRRTGVDNPSRNKKLNLFCHRDRDESDLTVSVMSVPRR